MGIEIQLKLLYFVLIVFTYLVNADVKCYVISVVDDKRNFFCNKFLASVFGVLFCLHSVKHRMSAQLQVVVRYSFGAKGLI
jgi:hypothetical protein